MIDAVPVRIWSVRPSGGPVYFNKRYKDHFRSVIPDFDTLAEPRIENLVQELTHPDDTPGVEGTLRSCFGSGNASVMRFRWREKDGDYRWAECRVEPRREEDGTVAEWYGVSLDIDEEMRAQQAVREREQELSQLVNMVPVHIRRLTPDGEPTFFNKRLLDFLGLPDVAQLDKPGMSRLAAAINTLVHPDDANRLLETIGRSLASGRALRHEVSNASGGWHLPLGRRSRRAAARPERNDRALVFNFHRHRRRGAPPRRTWRNEKPGFGDWSIRISSGSFSGIWTDGSSTPTTHFSAWSSTSGRMCRPGFGGSI